MMSKRAVKWFVTICLLTLLCLSTSCSATIPDECRADGLTGYLDGVLDDIYPTAASVHPYITHFDDYSSGNYDPMCPTGFTSVVDPPPSGNLVMAMNSRLIKLSEFMSGKDVLSRQM